MYFFIGERHSSPPSRSIVRVREATSDIVAS